MQLPVPFAKQDLTRLDVDQQNRINLYPHTKGTGLRQMPGQSEFGGFTAPSATGDSFDPSDNIIGMAWNSDGSKLLMNDDYLRLYSATDYDVGSLAYVSISPITLSAPSIASGIAVNDAGTEVFSIGTFKGIEKQTMSTGFDPTTLGAATTELTINELSGSSVGYRLQWASDGMSLLIADVSARKILQITCGSYQSLAGGSYLGSFNLAGYVFSNSVEGMVLSPDGKRVLVSIRSSASGSPYRVMELFLDQKDVITSAELVGYYDPTATVSIPAHMAYNGDGSQLSLTHKTTDIVYEFDIYQYRVAGDTMSGAARGMFRMADILYVVIGTSLFSVAAANHSTLLGSIPGTSVVGMSTDGTHLVITTGAQKFEYTVAAGLVEITDSDLSTAHTSAFLDQRQYYEQPNGQIIGAEIGDPGDVLALSFQTAESLNDDLLAVHTSSSEFLLALGARTVEIFKTSGVPRPLLRRQKAHHHGIIGRRAVASIEDVTYFLDDHRRPSRVVGLDVQHIVAAPALGKEFRSYTTVSDCIVSAFSYHGNSFAQFLFPSEDKCWLYHVESEEWTELQDENGAGWNISFYTTCYNKLLGMDRASAQVFDLTDSIYQIDGSNFTRQADSAIINSELFGAPNQRLHLSRTYLRYRTSGSAAITFTVARDSDLTSFGQSISETVSGEGTISIPRWPGGLLREAIIRVSTTANQKVDFLGLAVDVNVRKDTND
jgi:hypothetical protein